jgi:DNA-binding NarL/FixJ family response regulator
MCITIFLADDHTVVRDGLRFVLEAEPDFEVVGDAADGREAVRRVARLCPDVAIIDISMPELNGIEATQQILELCPATQVIVLSMHIAPEYVFRALRAGAQGYILKESAAVEVIKAVRAVSAGKRYLSQKISDMVVDSYIHQRELLENASPVERLIPREREILQLVVEGKSSSEIADILLLAPSTVDTYRSRMMQKLEISDMPGLVKFAIQYGLTTLE